MTEPRNALTPEALQMMDAIAKTGSFAAAARQLGKVPSALTYSVRQLEDALDVLLFDRRSRQASLTAAGRELLDEGRLILEQLDAVANRVKRVATGWETQLSIAVDGVVSPPTMLELCDAFYSQSGPDAAPPTRLRVRTEVLAGTWEALASGQADLAIGVSLNRDAPPGITTRELGKLEFVFAIAPHHPLARAAEPIDNCELVRHRAVAVADSAQRMTPVTVNLLPGQDVLTVTSVEAKVEAQLRGLGCGYLPEPMVREHIAAGRLVVREVDRATRLAPLGYAWRVPGGRSKRQAEPGLALRWWLDQLESAATRRALLERHGGATHARAA